jgi:signal peptidase II
LNPTDPTPGASSTTAETDRHSGVAKPRPLSERVRAYRLLWAIALAVFVADQATKLWVVKNILFDPWHTHGQPDAQIEVIPGFFYLIHVGNTGAAWSMFSGKSVLLALLAAATLIAIFFWRHALGLRARVSQVCFGLLCGGIVGNLLDRLLHKHVIDFIDLHFGRSYVYPTFNVADSAICVGVILYLWQSLKTPQAKDQRPETKD